MNIVKRLQQLAVWSRPISWINTVFPFTVAFLATGGVLNTYFFVAAFYFLIPYNVLIYVVNDVFDYESDKHNPRKNSIEGGLLPPETHRFMLLSTAALNGLVLAYLLSFGELAGNLVLLGCAAMALAYSLPVLRFKERPLIDSITSSLHFVGPMVYGLVLTGWDKKYWPYVLAFIAWGCASHAFGAVQDILADRQANIHSIATYFGARSTVRLAVGLYCLAVVCLAIAGWPAIVVGVPVLAYVYILLPYWAIYDNDAPTVNKAWKKFLVLNQVTGATVTILLIVTKVMA